jgi:hypothetical protein
LWSDIDCSEVDMDVHVAAVDRRARADCSHVVPDDHLTAVNARRLDD